MQEALPGRQVLVMCYVIQSKRPKGAPDRWSSHGGWLHEVLLRRKGDALQHWWYQGVEGVLGQALPLF